MANTETGLEVLGTPAPDSDTEVVETKHPRTLGQLERIVESNALRGAGLWRKAADALLEIRTQKLWKKAKDADGNKYPSFVVYAEDRFGFKKTYAYDLVKAATRKPEALTEGSARAEMAAEDRTPGPLQAHEAIVRMRKAFSQFEDKTANLRDRAIDDVAFVQAYDKWIGSVQKSFDAFAGKYPEPIEGTSEETVSPKRESEEASA
jgi:hypothetical protein